MMFTIKVAPSLLFNRINAEANAPELVENARILQNCGVPLDSLGDQVSAPINNSIRDIAGELDAPGANIPMFRPADIDGFFVNSDSAPKLNASFEAEHEKARVHPGDIVLAVAGTVAAAGRVPSWVAYGNVNGSCARIKPKAVVDGYLLAYLNSIYGFRTLMRLAVGSVQKHLNLEDLNEVTVPRPSEKALTYIGDKVRHADRLRNHARKNEQSFVSIIRQQCPEVFGEPKALGRSSWVKPSNLRRDLNPGAFNPERLRIRSEIQKLGGHELSELATVEASVTDSFGQDDDYIGLDSFSSSTSLLSPVKVAVAEIEGAARVLREGPVISKLRPYLNKVGYIPAEFAHAVGSTELLCVIPKPGINGWFIYGVLKLQCAVRQFQPLAKGSTHPRIDADDVLGVIIPWHDDADHLGQTLEQAQSMYFASEKLAAAAKYFVEALIGGKITEVELVAAQEALERDDDIADRLLLSRLTRKGIDVAGEPALFPDLDALYALLAQTEPATK